MSEALPRALEQSARRIAKSLGEDAADAVRKLYHQIGAGTEKVARNVEETEAEHVRELESLGRVHSREELRAEVGRSSTPVYRMDENGRIERLTEHGPQALTEEDRARLGLKLSGENRDHAPMQAEDDPRKYNLPEIKRGESRPAKPSRQVPMGGDDLSRATQLARHEAGDAGDYGKFTDKPKADTSTFTSNNYAAVRYGDKGDPDGFILVGRSVQNGAHSERNLGIPFLESGNSAGMTELYTEREPCFIPSNCSAWLATHLPAHVQVSHSFEYGASPESRRAGNALMEVHLNRLRFAR